MLIWNLRSDDSVVPMHVCTHGDCVSQVCWRPRSANDVTLLLSSSRDGYILIHKLTANFTIVQLHKRYLSHLTIFNYVQFRFRYVISVALSRFKIVKERNPVESARPRSAGGSERAAEAGLCITSFDFSPKHPSIFIVGTLCGGIYKCSLDSVTPIEGSRL